MKSSARKMEESAERRGDEHIPCSSQGIDRYGKVLS